jgi:hypothetical protein
MSIFHHRIGFTKHDPLDDGLGDMIAAEQAEADHISLTDDDDQKLIDFWDGVSMKLKKEPDWFDFTKE